MIQLDEASIALDAEETPENIQYITFDMNIEYSNSNPAIKIDFKNDYEYSINCIKKLLELEEKNIIFSTQYNNFNLKYIISNYSDEVVQALKAICIKNYRERITFLYNSLVKSLDEIWNTQNPCKFRNNICIASKNNCTAHKENGCCYSFEYSKNPLVFINNIHLCKHLSENKRCTTQNISCKLFVCKYLKKEKILNISIHDFLLINSFFNEKQQLILQYNFFRTKEEIIDKLLEKDTTPFFFFYWCSKYRI